MESSSIFGNGAQGRLWNFAFVSVIWPLSARNVGCADGFGVRVGHFCPRKFVRPKLAVYAARSAEPKKAIAVLYIRRFVPEGEYLAESANCRCVGRYVST